MAESLSALDVVDALDTALVQTEAMRLVLNGLKIDVQELSGAEWVLVQIDQGLDRLRKDAAAKLEEEKLLTRRGC